MRHRRPDQNHANVPHHHAGNDFAHSIHGRSGLRRRSKVRKRVWQFDCMLQHCLPDACLANSAGWIARVADGGYVGGVDEFFDVDI